MGEGSASRQQGAGGNRLHTTLDATSTIWEWRGGVKAPRAPLGMQRRGAPIRVTTAATTTLSALSQSAMACIAEVQLPARHSFKQRGGRLTQG